jgi:hypothetical protein
MSENAQRDEAEQPEPDEDDDFEQFHMVATNVALGGTMWVAQISFAESHIEHGGVADETVASVQMPWPLAKALSIMLTEAVANYEKSEGPLSIPRSVAAFIAPRHENVEHAAEVPEPASKG